MSIKHLSPNLYKIINILNDCQFHSGEEISVKLNITRSGVWKHVNRLETLGVKINTSPSRGYQFKYPLYLLDDSKIKKYCSDHTRKTINSINILNNVASTNDYIKQHYRNNFTIAVAEQQTAGKGRLGRKWHSPFGQNIYFSCLWNINIDISELNGLSIVVGLSIIEALRELGLENIGIKWPNDLLWNNKKFAGILIEVQAETNSFTRAIIGIGLNVNENPNIKDTTCLRKMTHKYYDKNVIVGKLLNHLCAYLEKYSSFGLKYFKTKWKTVDTLYQKQISIHQQKIQHVGIAQGIDNNGYLLVKTAEKLMHVSAGDASIIK